MRESRRGRRVLALARFLLLVRRMTARKPLFTALWLSIALSTSWACSSQTTHGPTDDDADASAGSRDAGREGSAETGVPMDACGPDAVGPGYCLRSCGDPTSVEEPDCVIAEGWRCPDGTTDPEDCLPDSCGGRNQYCCDLGTAEVTERTCKDDGELAACPRGSAAITGQGECSRLAENADNCAQLDGLSCEVEGPYCSLGCSLVCECSGDDSDGLTWVCVTTAC